MSTWKLETLVETVPGGAILTVRGRIGRVTADRFADALRNARRESARLVVDLAGVDYISGPGISALVATADSTEALILCGLGEAVRNTLDLAGVNGRVTIEETRQSAIEKIAL
jgi:anti-anti-sigma factor